MSFIKAFLVGHVINQGRKIYSGGHACLTKENVTEMLRASRRHHLCLWSSIFWHYINVDEVSWITLKKLLQSAMELLNLRQLSLLQSAMDSYYKLRQVLQSAMVIANCDSTCTGTRSVFTRAFGQKENFNAYFSAKRRSLLHPNTAQRYFFPLQSFSRKI